jgi:hypothetical protein
MDKTTSTSGPRGTALRPLFAEMYQGGRSCQEIGDALGMSGGAVYYHLRCMGIQRRPRQEAVKLTGARISRKLKGRRSPNYKGGRTRQGEGYVLIHMPTHPRADRSGYVFEHRLFMERHLGRLLTAEEVVHHRNGRKDDNRFENLEVMASQGDHLAAHAHCKGTHIHD